MLDVMSFFAQAGILVLGVMLLFPMLTVVLAFFIILGHSINSGVRRSQSRKYARMTPVAAESVPYPQRYNS